MRELSVTEYNTLALFYLIHKLDVSTGTGKFNWGVRIHTDLDEDDKACIAAGYAAENPLNPGNYYLTCAGGAYLNEDIVTPFDTEETAQ